MVKKFVLSLIFLSCLTGFADAQKYGGSSRSSSSSSSSRSSYSPSSSSRSSSSYSPSRSSSSKVGSSSKTSIPSTSSSSRSSTKSNYSMQNDSKKSFNSPTVNKTPSSTYSNRPSPVSSSKPVASKPKQTITKEKRPEVYTTVINNHNYSHPYSYYSSRPYYDVGGGYSSVFWYMMMEWSAERRAQWLYNHQGSINQSAFNEAVKDAAVAAELARLRSEGTTVNPSYVDKDFVSHPELMYEHKESSNMGYIMLYTMLGLGLVGVVVFFLFFFKVAD